MKIVLLVLLIGGLAFLLLRGQHRMIYHPRSYGATKPQLQAGLITLKYVTSQGRQTAFYLPPVAATSPDTEKLWLLLGGNGALALDWLELVGEFPDPRASFLLLDYPGYGYCQGRPGPETIMESAEAALAALAARMGKEPTALQADLRVMGHSLGAAVALLYAGRHQIKRLVLISPFTSLKDMAALVVGSLLSHTLLHDYDNRARLRELLAHNSALPVIIIHGNHDKVVPVSMGRELAGLDHHIEYLEIDRGDHNFILITAAAEIHRAMLNGSVSPP